MSSALCNYVFVRVFFVVVAFFWCGVVVTLCFIEMPLSWSRSRTVDDDDTGKRNNVAIVNANHSFIHSLRIVAI